MGLSGCTFIYPCLINTVCLSVCLFFCLSVCLPAFMSVCLSVCPSVCLSLSPSASVCLSVSVWLSALLSLCLPFCRSLSHCLPYAWLPTCLSVGMSTCRPVCRCVCLSFCLSVWLSVCSSYQCLPQNLFQLQTPVRKPIPFTHHTYKNSAFKQSAGLQLFQKSFPSINDSKVRKKGIYRTARSELPVTENWQNFAIFSTLL